MGIWVGLVAFVIVLLAGALATLRGGKAGRADRRELRRMRQESGRGVNAAEIAERRRAARAEPFPGSSGTPGGI